MPSGRIASFSIPQGAEVIAVDVAAAELEAGIAELSASLPSEEVLKLRTAAAVNGGTCRSSPLAMEAVAPAATEKPAKVPV